MVSKASKTKKKVKKNIVSGVAHINSTFNNTIITITDTILVILYLGHHQEIRALRVQENPPLLLHSLPQRKQGRKLWNMV